MKNYVKTFEEFNPVSSETMKDSAHFITNIDKATKDNTDFRRVLYTSSNMQLVVMNIPKGEDIGEETHDTIDQFIRVEDGTGNAVLNGMDHVIKNGSAFIIPKGTKHNIINTGESDLKLYSIYSPPNHAKETIHKTKQDAESKPEEFEGGTDTQKLLEQ